MPFPSISSFVIPPLSCQEPMVALTPAILLIPTMGILTIKDPILDFVPPTLSTPVSPIPPVLVLRPISNSPSTGSDSSWLPYLPAAPKPAGTSVHPTIHEVAQPIKYHRLSGIPRRAKTMQRRQAAWPVAQVVPALG